MPFVCLSAYRVCCDLSVLFWYSSGSFHFTNAANRSRCPV